MFVIYSKKALTEDNWRRAFWGGKYGANVGAGMAHIYTSEKNVNKAMKRFSGNPDMTYGNVNNVAVLFRMRPEAFWRIP